jgi:hypothetical protein
MVSTDSAQIFAPATRRLGRSLAGLALLLILATGCGRSASLVIVSVSGLEPAITELRVTMTLDGTPAKNQQPTADDPDASSFSVFKNMQSFGIQVPAGSQTLGVNIDGLNTSRAVVRTGSGTLDVSQQQDLAVAIR